jgi:hypothetical protein
LRALAGRALGLSAFPLERPAREASVKQLTARSDHLAVPRELAPAADDLLAEVRALPQQADPAPLNHVLAWAYLGNRADRLHRLLVECRLEAGAAICRLPDATAGGTDVDHGLAVLAVGGERADPVAAWPATGCRRLPAVRRCQR